MFANIVNLPTFSEYIVIWTANLSSDKFADNYLQNMDYYELAGSIDSQKKILEPKRPSNSCQQGVHAVNSPSSCFT